MIKPITPNHVQPVLDQNGNAGIPWYLFFDQLKTTASNGGGIVQAGSSAQRIALPTQGLPAAALWFETDTGLVYQWYPSVTQWAVVLGTYTQSYLLTVANTTINAPTQLTGQGTELVIAIMQDGTGGRTITWGNGFAFTSSSLGAGIPNTLSVFRFTLWSTRQLSTIGVSSTIPLYILNGQPTVDMLQ